MKYKFNDYTVIHSATPEMKEAVFKAVMNYFQAHKAFHGEVIMQSDACIIDAPSVMAYIADDIIKFKVIYKEDK